MNEKQFDLFQQAMQWVVDYHRNPDVPLDGVRHNQSTWVSGRIDHTAVITIGDYDYSPVCGTSCCFAGKAVLLAGDTVVAPSTAFSGEGAAACVDEDGVMHPISERAQELMGINNTEGAYLFSGSLTPEALVERGTFVAHSHGHDLVVI